MFLKILTINNFLNGVLLGGWSSQWTQAELCVIWELNFRVCLNEVTPRRVRLNSLNVFG